MPRPHRKARRVVTSDGEDEEDVQLVENTESESEQNPGEELHDTNNDDTDDDDVMQIDESFESAVESDNPDVSIAPTPDPKSRTSLNPLGSERQSMIDNTPQSNRKTSYSIKSDLTRTPSSSNNSAPSPSFQDANSPPDTENLDPEADNSKISNGHASIHSTPRRADFATPLGDVNNQNTNDLGIQVVQLEPIPQVATPVKQYQSPQKPLIDVTNTPASIRRPGTPPSTLVPPSGLGMPSLAPPKTPERNVVSFESDFTSKLDISARRQRLSLNDEINLVTISPSKGRLRAMEAEKAASMAEKPREPRLVISQLVLTDFKSYAGKQVIGPFDSSFSAVVGPNGSGKSNVIDSLLFVFGFRASKMRQGKISALIHKSVARSDINSCSVEIHFRDVIDQPDGTSATVPDSTLVVSRHAFKNNTSRYYINGKDSTFTEVTSLMRQRGIDLDHKRFLILQGEVESIAQMKPKAENDNDDGLLEYLEDIIGTSEYKKTIEESEAKLETLNEDCTSKAHRLDIVRKEIKGLQDKKDNVVRSLRLENDLVMKKSMLYQYKMHKLKISIKVNTESLAKLQEQLTTEREQTTGAKEEIEQLEKQVKEKMSELSSLKKKHSQLTKMVSKKELQKVSVEEKAKHLANKRKKLEKIISSSQHSFNEVDLWVQNYDEEVKSSKDRSEQLKQDLEAKTVEYNQVQNNLKGKTEGITKEIQKIQQELSPWRDKISAKESEIAIAQGEIDLITEKHETARKSLKDAKRKIHETVNEGQEKEAKVEELRKELTYTTEQIQIGTAHVKQASTERIKIKEDCEEARLKYQLAKESVNSVKSQGAVLTSLTNLSNSGRVEGFNGRLGSLGTIDQKYDVAISTACPALDNLVVDTVENGEACVDYLRRNNIGRAKFILLDKIPQRSLNPIKTPEDVPRLFDLVQPKEPRFAHAFYSVLFDTLVAKDVEQARRIAYGARRFRVVTLDGILIDTSGTMSGGGQKARGRMMDQLESTVSTAELESLERDVNKHEERYQKAEAAFEKMNIKLKELQRRKPELELEISKANLDIEALTTSLNEVQKYYKDLKKNISSNLPSGDELEEKQSKKDHLEQELEELKANSSDLEDKIKALNEKIMEIGGVKLRFLKSEIDGITGEMEMINTRLSTRVIERTKKDTERKKHQRAIQNAERDIAESESEFAASEQELRTQMSEVAKSEQELEEIRVAVEQKEDEMEEIKAQAKEKREIVDKTLSAEIELTNTIEQHEKAIKDFERKLNHYFKSYKELKLHAIHDIPNVDVNNNSTNDDSQQQPSTQQQKSDKTHDANDEDEEMIDADKEETQEEEDKEVAPQDFTDLAEYPPDELEAMNTTRLQAQIEELESDLKGVTINMDVIFEYARRAKEFNNRRDEVNNAVSERDNMKNYCESLRKRRLDEFLEGFNMISMKLKEMYQMITMGGNAELELVDSLDPFSEGILFSVMPPKKSWKNISNLSGGEKTLSSLALVFALHHYKPTPLYVMDEIDAALDFRNVSIVANYIKERTKNGQFIVISLRNNMFELASQLIGIYKVNNMTKSVPHRNRDHNQHIQQQQYQQQQKVQSFLASQTTMNRSASLRM